MTTADMLVEVTNFGDLAVLVPIAAAIYVAAGVGSVIVMLIAISRVALHDHSWLETLLGSAIGAVALGTFGCKYAVSRRDHVSLRPLLLSVALLLILLHGRMVHAESMLRAMSGYLKETSGITCGSK